MPAITNSSLSFVELSRLFSLEIYIRKLLELFFETRVVIIVLVAEVPFVDVLSKTIGFEVVQS